MVKSPSRWTVLLPLLFVLLTVFLLFGTALPVMADGEDPRDPDLVYLEIRPDLDETRIRGNAGIPADYQTGIWNGYSMPIWDAGANIDQELYFLICVPERWNEESDIIIHMKWATEGNELNNVAYWEVAWLHATPDVPETLSLAAPTVVTSSRTVDSGVLNAFYEEYFVVDYDIIPGDPITLGDTITFRIRHFGAKDTLVNEAALIEVGVDFARGDLLGEEENMAEAIFLYCLIVLVLGLTVALFVTRNLMLGFPCVIFWAILGGYTYGLSVVTWDWQYSLFFASMGMVMFSAIAMYALRNKDLSGPDADKGEFIDEEQEPDLRGDVEVSEPSKRVQDLRNRANRRRTR